MCELYKPICEVGSARSGTNFLSRIIAAHEDVAFWYIPKYIWRHGNAWWPDDCLTEKHARPRVKRYIRKRFAEFVREKGKKRFLENNQTNVLALPFINEVLPDCKIVHIIRDGRDVAASLHRRWHEPEGTVFQAVKYRLPSVPLTDWPAYFPDFVKTATNRLLKKKVVYSFGPRPRNWKRLRAEHDLLAFTAITWRECVTSARTFGRTLPPDRYYEIRFEDLFSRTDEVVTEMMAFLELAESESVKRYVSEKIDHAAKGRWRKNMSPEDEKIILEHAGDLMRELGMI